MSTTPTTTQRLIRLPDVLERVGMSKSTLYSRVRAGTFPKPVHLGTLSAWVESEVGNWVATQIEKRDRVA
ncbi:helix-turn-helix transcriptional regulator [Xanthomonas campestris]|uniref:helix-turn-helix transcriptional regulator n=1 Tax=Xanthomonas campestris TaxID=339 RepID=UPI000E32AE68|nr:AlpA family transcriptional regulator [Xanthomonas campestris]RFF46221.1 AlpA family transcriptional regulator [Xanthomonas campestris]